MLNKLPKEIQTIIYKHLFNSILEDLKVATSSVKTHFLISKGTCKKDVHDCEVIDIIGFDNIMK